MAHIVAVVNQKGGVGKTTTAVNLSAGLAAAGQRVLCVDFDPQGNATSGFGIPKHPKMSTIYHVLAGKAAPHDLLWRLIPNHLDLLPANAELGGAEVELAQEAEREYWLRGSLLEAVQEYDTVLIDCPPSLGLLTVNALVVANSVLIPLQCEFYALEGLTQLLRTIDITREQLNPDLKLSGILLTMFDMNNRLNVQVAHDVRRHMPDRLLKTTIPRNHLVAEAPSFGKPVLWYDIDCPGSHAFLSLAQEWIELNKTFYDEV
ncbi:MAG: AAA family ATPase [Magnetococcus sp. DMHC-6]